MIVDNRIIHSFHGRGRNDIEALAAVVAEQLIGKLYHCDGRLCLLEEGKIVVVSRNMLQSLVALHVASPRLVPNGERYECAYEPLIVRSQDLVDLYEKLVQLAAAGVSRPRQISERERGYIQQRLAQGESPESIGRAYDLPSETVKSMRTAA
jgi:hypothetical protein